MTDDDLTPGGDHDQASAAGLAEPVALLLRNDPPPPPESNYWAGIASQFDNPSPGDGDGGSERGPDAEADTDIVELRRYESDGFGNGRTFGAVAAVALLLVAAAVTIGLLNRDEGASVNVAGEPPAATAVEAPTMTPTTDPIAVLPAEGANPDGAPLIRPYRVREHDSADWIAAKFGLSLQEFTDANPDHNPDELTTGDWVGVPLRPWMNPDDYVNPFESVIMAPFNFEEGSPTIDQVLSPNGPRPEPSATDCFDRELQDQLAVRSITVVFAEQPPIFQEEALVAAVDALVTCVDVPVLQRALVNVSIDGANTYGTRQIPDIGPDEQCFATQWMADEADRAEQERLFVSDLTATIANTNASEPQPAPESVTNGCALALNNTKGWGNLERVCISAGASPLVPLRATPHQFGETVLELATAMCVLAEKDSPGGRVDIFRAVILPEGEAVGWLNDAWLIDNPSDQ